MMQNVNEAMWSDETLHRTQRARKTWVRLRHWENQHRLSSDFFRILVGGLA